MNKKIGYMHKSNKETLEKLRIAKEMTKKYNIFINKV